MFQYAFAVSTSKKVNTLFLLYLTSNYNSYLLGYFHIDPITDCFFKNQFLKKIYRSFCRKIEKKKLLKSFNENQFSVVECRENNSFYYGYFQSEEYFKFTDKTIKKRFKVKQKYVNLFREKYSYMFLNHKIIVVHFRRKDYNDIELESLGGKGYVLPIDYYNTALSTIKDIHAYEVFFIGDDMNSIKKDFELKPNYHFEENSSIVDFQLIQNADIAIIGNSTFAWWAAYLSLKPNSRILAPKYWLGFKVKETFPPKIETNKFEWIEF